MRAVEPGAGVAAAAGVAAGLRHRGDGPARRASSCTRCRVREARLRRPRGVLRRSGVRRGAARRTCSRRHTTTSAAGWSARTRLARSCGPGTVAGFSPVGGPRRRRPRAEMLTRAPGVGEPTVARLGVIGADTCHIDVIDRHGNMVSATPSGGWLQSSPVIPGLGFPLGTRGQMFWLQPGLPQQPRARASGRARRCRRSMALRDGRAWMAFGTPGGEQQDQWSLDHVPAHGAPRPRHPAGDRRAVVPHRALAEQLLAAHRPPRQGGAGGPLSAAPCWTTLRARGHLAELGERRGARAGCPARAPRAGRADVRRRQPARDAGLRGRALALPRRLDGSTQARLRPGGRRLRLVGRRPSGGSADLRDGGARGDLLRVGPQLDHRRPAALRRRGGRRGRTRRLPSPARRGRRTPR